MYQIILAPPGIQIGATDSPPTNWKITSHSPEKIPHPCPRRPPHKNVQAMPVFDSEVEFLNSEELSLIKSSSQPGEELTPLYSSAPWMVHKSRLREHLNNTLLIYRAGLRPSLCAAWPNLWRRARCRESKIRAQWHKENTCTNSSHIRKHLTFVQKPIQFLGWNGRTAVLILFSPLFYLFCLFPL